MCLISLRYFVWILQPFTALITFVLFRPKLELIGYYFLAVKQLLRLRLRKTLISENNFICPTGTLSQISNNFELKLQRDLSPRKYRMVFISWAHTENSWICPLLTLIRTLKNNADKLTTNYFTPQANILLICPIINVQCLGVCVYVFPCWKCAIYCPSKNNEIFLTQ